MDYQRFFVFTCQLKKLNAETFSFSSDDGFTANRRFFISIFSIKFEKKIETHPKYSSSSKCVENRDIRMKQHKHLTFRLILRKKFLGSSRFEPKITFRFIYAVNRMSRNRLSKIFYCVF